MNFPLISEYIESIKNAEDSFAELNNLRPVLDDNGQPVMSSGNFAVVFKMKDEESGKLHAVKCFLREQEGRAEAYRQIAEELENVNTKYLASIKYLDKELYVDTANSNESEFPVLLMDWVEGLTLDKYLKKYVHDYLTGDNTVVFSESWLKYHDFYENAYKIENLAYQFGLLSFWLIITF